MIKEIFLCGICAECQKSVWLWQSLIHSAHPSQVHHYRCVDADTVATKSDPEQIRVERIIRDEFDHFDDAYLIGGEHRLMRLRTNRLCEDIVRTVLREID